MTKLESRASETSANQFIGPQNHTRLSVAALSPYYYCLLSTLYIFSQLPQQFNIIMAILQGEKTEVKKCAQGDMVTR